jgi:ATP-dependent Clp protease adaptor protein ClpS
MYHARRLSGRFTAIVNEMSRAGPLVNLDSGVISRSSHTKPPRHKIAAMATSLPAQPPVGPALPGRDDGEGSVVAEKQEQRVEPPKLYQVVMLNDDYTPMEFVVLVLQEYFLHDLDTATLIMLKIHHEGRGICGVYSKDVATTKVELVQAAAKRAGHPLQCTLEAA